MNVIGTSVAGAYHPADVDFLVDLTYRDGDSAVIEQEVFPAVFDLIDEAQQFVVIDMFLFNGEHGGDRAYVPLTEHLVERIVAPLIEEARNHTTPSIERSVLIRMGFSGAEAKALVARMAERGLLGRGAGRLVLELARTQP